MRLSKARKEYVTAMMKDTIFEAAGSVLEEHGVHGITMDRVANVAGLAKGSLYNYFHDKDDLLQFIYARLVEPFLQTIEEIAAEQSSAPEKLEKILRTALESSDKHKAAIRLLMETDQEHEVRKSVRPRILRIFSEIFEHGIIEGSFRPHSVAHTARMFLGCFGELFELQAIDASDEEIEGYVQVLIDATQHGFSIHVEKE